MRRWIGGLFFVSLLLFSLPGKAQWRDPAWSQQGAQNTLNNNIAGLFHAGPPFNLFGNPVPDLSSVSGLNQAIAQVEANGGDTRKLRARLHYLLPRAYPNDRVDWTAYERAEAFRAAMPAAPIPILDALNGLGGPGPGVVGTAPARGTAWTFVGPLNLDVPFRPFFGARATSGRVTALAWDPRNMTSPGGSSIVYLGSSGGGIWKSTDKGLTWTQLTDFRPEWTSLQVSSLAVDTNGAVYAGTGDFRGFFRPYGFGLMKSTDGGMTWTNVGGALTAGTAITHILVDPENPMLVTITTAGRTRSNDIQYRGQATGQVLRSVNGGVTFAPVAALNNVIWTDASIGSKSNTGQRFYYVAGMTAGGAATVFRSSDRGVNWGALALPAAIGAGETSMSVVASPVNPNTVYVMSGASQTIQKSTMAGAAGTWNSVITAGFPGGANWGQANYDFYLNCGWVLGGNIDVVYSGLITIAGSTNGGNSWKDIGMTQAAGAFTHSDQQCLTYNPRNPYEILFGNDGGVYGFQMPYNPRTPDWSAVNTTNSATLGVTQFYTAAYHPTNRDIMIGGTQDNSTPLSFQKGSASPLAGRLNMWDNAPSGGDGGACAINSLAERTQYAIGNFYINGNPPDFGVDRTTNAWNTSATIPFPVYGAGDIGAFTGAIALDPTGDKLYVATNYLYRYMDGAAAYDSSDDGLMAMPPNLRYRLGPASPGAGAANYAASGQRLAGAGGFVSAVAIAPGDTNRVYTASSDGQVWMTRNARNMNVTMVNWEQINNAGLPVRFLTSIAVDPYNQNRVFVGLSGTGAHHLWRCDNTTAVPRVWNDVDGGGLPDISLNSVTLDPNNGNTIYVGTDLGVYFTTDGGTTWNNVTLNNGGMLMGLPAVQVNDLQAIPGTNFLNAATFGRGIWRVSLGAGPQFAAFGLSPNPVTGGQNVTYTIALAQPAPNNNTVVTVTSNNQAVVPLPIQVPRVPGMVAIAQGQFRGQFTVTTGAVAANTVVTLTVTINGETRTTQITVTP